MRELTKQEYENRALAYIEHLRKFGSASGISFNAGFVAGLDYQQRKLNAYAAYVAGKITLKELEEVING